MMGVLMMRYSGSGISNYREFGVVVRGFGLEVGAHSGRSFK